MVAIFLCAGLTPVQAAEVDFAFLETKWATPAKVEFMRF